MQKRLIFAGFRSFLVFVDIVIFCSSSSYPICIQVLFVRPSHKQSDTFYHKCILSLHQIFDIKTYIITETVLKRPHQHLKGYMGCYSKGTPIETHQNPQGFIHIIYNFRGSKFHPNKIPFRNHRLINYTSDDICPIYISVKNLTKSRFRIIIEIPEESTKSYLKSQTDSTNKCPVLFSQSCHMIKTHLPLQTRYQMTVTYINERFQFFLNTCIRLVYFGSRVLQFSGQERSVNIIRNTIT